MSPGLQRFIKASPQQLKQAAPLYHFVSNETMLLLLASNEW
jgi:hypothetical protein